MEAYGETIKTYKYYYCVTFFVYESMWLFSNFTIFYVLINLWFTENWSALPSSLFVSIERYVEFLCYVSAGYMYFSHWIKNTLVHISLCRYETFSVSIIEEKLLHSLFIVVFIFTCRRNQRKLNMTSIVKQYVLHMQIYASPHFSDSYR